MITKYQVKEISCFITTFLNVFDSDIIKNRNELSGEGESAQGSFRVAFKVTGAIDGYLIATHSSSMIVSKDLRLAPHCAEKLIHSYHRLVASMNQFSAFTLEIIDTVLIDEILYSARKAEPQMTFRIAMNNTIIEFYVLAIKQLPGMANEAPYGAQDATAEL